MRAVELVPTGAYAAFVVCWAPGQIYTGAAAFGSVRPTKGRRSLSGLSGAFALLKSKVLVDFGLGSLPTKSAAYRLTAIPTWRILLRQPMRLALTLALVRAGKSRAAS